MAQVKIYGLTTELEPIKKQLSQEIHACLVDAFGLPPEKRFQRFIGLEPADFLYPLDRSERYIIIEILMFAGRSKRTKKQFIQLLYKRLAENLGLPKEDIELVMLEMPRENWGIRGLAGDDIMLNYQVEV